jgi:hypothetical protein
MRSTGSIRERGFHVIRFSSSSSREEKVAAMAGSWVIRIAAGTA